MNGDLISKLEIDVLQHNELSEAVELAIKNGLPSLVIHPNLIPDAIVLRGITRSSFKIIAPIDWPKGDVLGYSKFKGMTTDVLESEGFEFAINAQMPESVIAEQIGGLTELVKTKLSATAEVRFVLSSERTEEEVQKFANGLKDARTPAFVRNDILTKNQQSKANANAHNKFADTIKNAINVPIKISGNLNNYKTLSELVFARFGVNLQQAKTIIKEYNSL